MTADLKRRIAALEAQTSTSKPVREMTDAELLEAVGLGDDVTDEELMDLLNAAEREGQPVQSEPALASQARPSTST